MKYVYAMQAFFLWLLLSVAASVHAYAQTQPLVDEQQLAALIELPSVRVIDIRPPKDYAAGHIPGAISAPYGQWRGPANNPGQLISIEDLQQLVRSLGIDKDQHLVVYSSGDSQTDFGAAARVYWTLKYAGLPHLSVLNGGYQQWQRAALSESMDTPAITASSFEVQPNNSIVILKEELLEKINNNQNDYQLIDARPQAFYEGKVKAPTASIGGTIAGAKNAQHQQWFNEENATLKPADQIRQQIVQQGLDQAPQTVSFCNTGHWAATNWFVLSEIGGLPQVRLYPASLAEWTQAEQALPMSNTPSRAQQIRAKFQALIKSE